MDVAEDERRVNPSAREFVNLGISGLLARIMLVVGRIPVRRRSRIAVGATIIGSAAAATQMVLGEVGRWFRYGSYGADVALFGPFTTAASLVYLLCLFALLATVLRLPKARVAAHLLTIGAAITLPLGTTLTQTAITPDWYIPAFFAVAAALALIGDPNRTEGARALMMWSAPVLAAGVTFAAYRHGAGARTTYYSDFSWNQFPVTMSFVLALAFVTALTLSNRAALPWVTYLVVFASPLYLWFTGLAVQNHPAPYFIGSSVLAAAAAWYVTKRPPHAKDGYTPAT
ncbi:hypothetical protein [Arthrobacter sp. W4I7]|uniref:hypothetical protein n=1 Tax=Arthrobacter sp. W4I7 TaxID=3042296 RepID=UPI0027838432|nr:hypothetical protein [Arthrobacter sp. W4I7]MDQ0692535.1 hypothetical protein [Arthrobacter sp. W4I7]